MASDGPRLVGSKVDPARDADRRIGARIRQRRVALGLTQQQVATMVGVTYQQAYKYESGMNRVSAGRLFDFAQVLDVNVAYFFEGLSEARADTKRQDRSMLALARNFAAISNPAHREAVAALVRAMAAVGAHDEDSA